MEIVNAISVKMTGISVILIIIFFVMLIFFQEMTEKMEKLIIITIITFFIGIILFVFTYQENNQDKTLTKIESSLDYALYYDKDTNIIYCITSDSTTPLYNADGSFKLYTED